MAQTELFTADGRLGQIVRPLLDWYARSARVLPWRENTDPYRVWISEIMLQQTRVETVIPYYNRFLHALPDVRALAGVPEDKLLKLWEGLGYYSRARSLKKAAQLIVAEGGEFPRDFEGVSRLPGVGPYTAGAICSIALGLPTPAVDGNVLRVLCRLFCCAGRADDPRLRAEATRALAPVYPAGHCGDFTQSLMELGALVCLPNGAPLCEKCPLAGLCAAHAAGRETDYPVRAVKTERRREEYTVFLLRCGERVAVRRRESGGLLGGLWELPNTVGLLSGAQAAEWLSAHGIRVPELYAGGEKKHIFTHVEWRMRAYTAVCENAPEGFVWADAQRLGGEIPLPTAFRKFLNLLEP